MTGFIALHREILNWEWWDDHSTSRLFIACLLLANHKEKKWKGETVGRGQFITSLESLSKKTGISIRSVRTSLDKLRKSENLTIKSTNKFTLLTIVNYDKYQSADKQTTHGRANERQTTDKQLTTTNNDNNVNKNKEPYAYEGEVIRLIEKDFDEWEKRSGMSFNKFMDFLNGRDKWYSTQPPQVRKNWFYATSQILAG